VGPRLETGSGDIGTRSSVRAAERSEPSPHIRPRHRRAVALRNPELKFMLFLGDALAVAVGSLIAPELWAAFDRNYQPGVGVQYWQVTSIPLWLVALRIADGHSPGRPASWRLLASVGQALMGMIVLVLVLFYAAPFFAPRGSTFISLPFVAVAALAWRVAYARLLGSEVFDLNVAIVGIDDAARRTARVLLDANSSYRLQAFLVPNDETDAIFGVPVVAVNENLWAVVRELGVDQLVVAQTQSLPPTVLNELVRCFDHGVETVPATAIYEEISGRVLASSLEADWYAELPTHARGFYARARRVADLLVGGLLLVLTAPLMVLIAIAVWFDSGRPILLRQVRVGQRGRPFVIHKFRTMRPDAESAGHAIWASLNDERATRIGLMLRRSRLDELPQLWDVVRGAMSLIGPRPERPEFVERLAAELPLFRARTLVRPGITGWAQVEYRYADSVFDNLTKLEYDLFYLRHLGPLLDLTIVLRTISIIIRFRGR
jgi:exopolysaccharide biosynthesis polyprenyl glycosylphosphotransferase